MRELPATKFLNRSTPPHIATLIVLAGIGALSMNLFLPSLPQMAGYFDTDYRVMQLSISLFLAVSAIVQIFVGPISDVYGRRPIILWLIGLFMLATIGCLLAPNITVFLTFRMLQATIVGGLVLSRAAVRDMVPTAEAASMIGYVTMGMSLVPMIGPVIGGSLGEALGWQANFWLLLILSAVIFALAWLDMGETAIRRTGGLRAQIREYPELLRSQRFWGYSLAATLASGTFFAYLGGAPFIGSAIFGLSDSTLGFYFGAPALGYLVGNYLSGKHSTRLGINRMILMGTLIPCAGIFVSIILFYLGFGSAKVFFGFMTIIGLGNGLVIPNAQAGMLSVRPQLAGSAAGLGGSLMLAIGAALSAYAGTLLHVQTGALPVLWLMLICSALSFSAILWVIRRGRISG